MDRNLTRKEFVKGRFDLESGRCGAKTIWEDTSLVGDEGKLMTSLRGDVTESLAWQLMNHNVGE